MHGRSRLLHPTDNPHLTSDTIWFPINRYAVPGPGTGTHQIPKGATVTSFADESYPLGFPLVHSFIFFIPRAYIGLSFTGILGRAIGSINIDTVSNFDLNTRSTWGRFSMLQKVRQPQCYPTLA